MAFWLKILRNIFSILSITMRWDARGQIAVYYFTGHSSVMDNVFAKQTRGCGFDDSAGTYAYIVFIPPAKRSFRGVYCFQSVRNSVIPSFRQHFDIFAE